jgi:hypothetical protein
MEKFPSGCDATGSEVAITIDTNPTIRKRSGVRGTVYETGTSRIVILLSSAAETSQRLGRNRPVNRMEVRVQADSLIEKALRVDAVAQFLVDHSGVE